MARIPNMNKVQVRDINEPIYQTKRISSFIEPDRLGFDLSEEKSKNAFVKYIEKIVRGSFEYKELIKFLREQIDMNYCSYFKNVNNKINGITIEIHHEPFTLYDITYIIMEMYLKEGYPLKPSNIAEEVMALHFYGMVGLLPLSKTVHELVHVDEIIVPITYVFGDVERFYRKYWQYMTTQQKEILAKSIKIADKLETLSPKVLQKKFTYLDVDGMVIPKYIE